MFKKAFILFFFLLFSITAFAENQPAVNQPMVRIVTNMGNIELELNRDKAPRSVENFLRYAKDGAYSGTIFHRVIKGFMIQGGGFTQNFERKPTRQAIANEANNGLKNNLGTIAMARTNMPHSATSQFFINTANNDFLNHTSKTPRGWGYAVFGKVTKGLKVVKDIENSTTGPKGIFNSDAPVKDVVILKVEIISE